MVDADSYFEANPKMKFKTQALSDDPLVPQIDVEDYVHVAASGTTRNATSTVSSLNRKDTTAVEEALRVTRAETGEGAIQHQDASKFKTSLLRFQCECS